MAHMPVMAVDQYTWFAHVGRKLMNMRIVDADQQDGFGLRIGHFGNEQRGVGVFFFYRAVADTYFVTGGGSQNALDHLVVKISLRTSKARAGAKIKILFSISLPVERPSKTPCALAHSSTLSRALLLVLFFPAKTRETVLIDNPVWSAICWIFNFPFKL